MPVIAHFNQANPRDRHLAAVLQIGKIRSDAFALQVSVKNKTSRLQHQKLLQTVARPVQHRGFDSHQPAIMFAVHGFVRRHHVGNRQFARANLPEQGVLQHRGIFTLGRKSQNLHPVAWNQGAGLLRLHIQPLGFILDIQNIVILTVNHCSDHLYAVTIRTLRCKLQELFHRAGRDIKWMLRRLRFDHQIFRPRDQQPRVEQLPLQIETRSAHPADPDHAVHQILALLNG